MTAGPTRARYRGAEHGGCLASKTPSRLELCERRLGGQRATGAKGAP
jgi:hypothetical protein